MELHHSGGFSISYRRVPLANEGDGVDRSVVGLWVLVMMIGSGGLYGCGLDGMTGTLVRVHGDWYRIQTPSGGVRVHAYVLKSGHAACLQRLERWAGERIKRCGSSAHEIRV